MGWISAGTSDSSPESLKGEALAKERGLAEAKLADEKARAGAIEYMARLVFHWDTLVTVSSDDRRIVELPDRDATVGEFPDARYDKYTGRKAGPGIRLAPTSPVFPITG